MKVFLVLCSMIIQLSTFSQSYHVSGYAINTTVLLENNSATDDAKLVYLSITDNNGSPVNGLKPNQFVAFQIACKDNSDCKLISANISRNQSGTMFLPLGQGIYRITFNVPLSRRTGLPLNSILVQVIGIPMLGVTNTIKGQILIQ